MTNEKLGAEQGRLRINYVERSHPQIVASECVSALAKLGVITCENQVKVHDAIAAERGTTPPEGLREALAEEFHNAGHCGYDHGTWAQIKTHGIECQCFEAADIALRALAATQRAPVKMLNCGICGKPFPDDNGKGFCICILD